MYKHAVAFSLNPKGSNICCNKSQMTRFMPYKKHFPLSIIACQHYSFGIYVDQWMKLGQDKCYIFFSHFSFLMQNKGRRHGEYITNCQFELSFSMSPMQIRLKCAMIAICLLNIRNETGLLRTQEYSRLYRDHSSCRCVVWK